MRVYLFVDAENHFLRSVAAAKDTIGSANAPKALAQAEIRSGLNDSFPGRLTERRFLFDPAIQLFWDREVLPLCRPDHLSGWLPDRAIYVCSCAGDETKAREMRVAIRNLGFEPIVIPEPKPKYEQRRATLEQYKVIEKPKGCDIAIATRMVADAAANLYDFCLLFTSDGDFMPAVESVRQMGKDVYVCGYAGAVSNDSRYLHVPDRFVDLEEILRATWRNNEAPITATLAQLDDIGPCNPPQ
jgi:uncharacterized LabA/DUF88 family protein